MKIRKYIAMGMMGMWAGAGINHKEFTLSLTNKSDKPVIIKKVEGIVIPQTTLPVSIDAHKTMLVEATTNAPVITLKAGKCLHEFKVTPKYPQPSEINIKIKNSQLDLSSSQGNVKEISRRKKGFFDYIKYKFL